MLPPSVLIRCASAMSAEVGTGVGVAFNCDNVPCFNKPLDSSMAGVKPYWPIPLFTLIALEACPTALLVCASNPVTSALLKLPTLMSATGVVRMSADDTPAATPAGTPADIGDVGVRPAVGDVLGSTIGILLTVAKALVTSVVAGVAVVAAT